MRPSASCSASAERTARQHEPGRRTESERTGGGGRDRRRTSAPEPEYAQVSREVRPAPPRYRNEIGKFSVHRAPSCQQCGKCVELCPHGVHVRPDGYRSVMRPFDYRCIGFECEQTDHYCVDACEHKALSITKNPVFETLGDCRWTADLIVSTWQHGRDRPRPARASRERDRCQRRRLRSAAVSLPAVSSLRSAPRGHLDRAGSQPAQRFAAEDARSTFPGTAAACPSARRASGCC